MISREQAIAMKSSIAGLAALALVAAVTNGISGANFPSNAPVEQLYNFGITIDLIAVANGLNSRRDFPRVLRIAAELAGVPSDLGGAHRGPPIRL